MSEGASSRPLAVLVSLQLAQTSDQEHQSNLDELERLVYTLGFETIGRVSQKRRNEAPGTLLGAGKLKELAAWTGGTGVVQRFGTAADETLEEEYEDEGGEGEAHTDNRLATIVIVDRELSPSQLKNLEDATGVEVLDRTGVILEIFSRHANSRESRMQVEIAKLAYMAPRLRLSKIGGDRQGGGIGAKGAGETSHELDRRRIRDRIAELKAQVESIRSEQSTKRNRRRSDPTVALVGYTNAGKSSLMRALTGSEVLVADKLFATLGTTVRAMEPQTSFKILISDTVGFIRNLPHDLIASFHSTLDEAKNASLLFFTVDCSDNNFRQQLEVTQTVLGEIKADDIPSRLIFNKIDKLAPNEIATLATEFPDAIMISTRNPEDIDRLKGIIRAFFEKDMIDKEILVPYSKGKAIGVIHANALVIREEHLDTGTRLTVRAHPEVHEWLEKHAWSED